MGDLFGAVAEAPAIRKSAIISPCGLYRYRLERRWSDAPLLPFVMLNPSTADAEVDDPTIRRCMGFARREGAGGIVVGNVFAFRATRPSALLIAENRVGPGNQEALLRIAVEAVATGMPIVCGWGAEQFTHAAVTAGILTSKGARLVCLGKTAACRPRHPLYVKADQPLEPFP